MLSWWVGVLLSQAGDKIELCGSFGSLRELRKAVSQPRDKTDVL